MKIVELWLLFPIKNKPYISENNIQTKIRTIFYIILFMVWADDNFMDATQTSIVLENKNDTLI